MKDLDEFLAKCRECNRALAVKLDLQGYASPCIETLLGVSGSFIRKWRGQYERYGIERLYLQYQGSQGYLSPEERAEVIALLKSQDSYSLEALREYGDAHYAVLYKSKQSYYDLLPEAHISWKKTEKTNPARDEAKVLAKREELPTLLKDRQEEIESGQLVVFLEDEGHLLWGAPLGYVWGRMHTTIPVPSKNEKARQTSYGAINMATKDFHVCPFPKGERVDTVKFVKHLRALYPRAKRLIIGDGARYHRYAEMPVYLQDSNQGLDQKDWKVTCELLAPHAPEQNPVEDIWLKGRNFLRKYCYKHTTFAQVKKAFLHVLQTTKFDFPKFKLYAYN